MLQQIYCKRTQDGIQSRHISQVSATLPLSTTTLQLTDTQKSGQSEQENLKEQFEAFKKDAWNEIFAQRKHLQAVAESLRTFELKNQNEITSAAPIHSDRMLEQSLDNVMKKTRNLSAKVEVLDIELSDLNRVHNKLEAWNSSLQMMASRLDGFRSADSPSSNHFVEGIILGQYDGLVLISLPSLQKTKISSDISHQVAFDANSRKVYWLNRDYDMKRANLDGTDEEYVARGNVGPFALDSITGNFYYQNFSSAEVKVCSKDGEKCSVLARNPNKLWHGMALYPSKSLIFGLHGTSLVRSNMDGTNATVILTTESVRNLFVDEDSDRVYWTSYWDKERRAQVGSCDLNGQDQRVLVNASTFLSGVAVDGDRVIYADLHGKSLNFVGKGGGSSKTIARTTGSIADFVLYGSKIKSHENSCESSPCSHLCVLKLESFACLCPEGEQLAQDGTTCAQLN